MVSEKNDRKRRGLRPLVAGLVAAATLLSPCVAYAGEGGAGSGSGSGTGDGTGVGEGKVSWVYKDSWGAPTRENAIAAVQGRMLAPCVTDRSWIGHEGRGCQ